MENIEILDALPSVWHIGQVSRDDTLPKILLVDDDPTVARWNRRIAERFAATRTAANVAEAVVAIREEASLLAAVFDLGLPDGSGFDVLRMLRERHPTVPALILTGKLDREFVNRAHLMRAEYVVKPAEPEHLRTFFERARTLRYVGTDALVEQLRLLTTRYGLTSSESLILTMTMQNVSREEILERLSIAEGTLKAQTRNLLRKCNADSLRELAMQVMHRTIAGVSERAERSSSRPGRPRGASPSKVGD